MLINMPSLLLDDDAELAIALVLHCSNGYLLADVFILSKSLHIKAGSNDSSSLVFISHYYMEIAI